MHRTTPHEWHLFDSDKGVYVRQVTQTDEDNKWQISMPGYGIVVIDDPIFNTLREGRLTYEDIFNDES